MIKDAKDRRKKKIEVPTLEAPGLGIPCPTRTFNLDEKRREGGLGPHSHAFPDLLRKSILELPIHGVTRLPARQDAKLRSCSLHNAESVSTGTDSHPVVIATTCSGPSPSLPQKEADGEL